VIRRLSLVAAALLAGAGAAFGHDFWIEPSSFHPAVPSDLAVSLRVGQGFRGDPVPRMDDRIVKFVLAGPGGEAPIPGLPGTDPAGLVKVTRPGAYVIAYRSGRTPIALEADKFEKYLAEEGLESVLAARKRKGESGRPGAEVYSRCAKSLVFAGNGERAGFDRSFGMTLELSPEKSPLAARAGEEFPMRLVHEGKPLEGALIVALNQTDPGVRISARSDRRGRVALRLPRNGVWLVKSVHMVPAPPETKADWESLWASLTFEIP